MSSQKNMAKVDYLRIAITDRCNFRCIYCMPAGGLALQGGGEMLSCEEIVRIAGIAAELGIRRVRLTGGEPLVRQDCAELVWRLSRVKGIEEVSLTTNGSRLESLAGSLKDAGLSRVNVSLDSLSPERFKAITRGGDLNSTLRGIKKAWSVGLEPVKLNVVILPGLAEELDDFMHLISKYPFHVRFIEQMDIGAWRDNYQNQFIPYQSIKQLLELRGPLTPTTIPTGAGPARYYRFLGQKGTVGFISAVAHGSCRSCRRLRLTADGKLKSCLFSEKDIDIGNALGDDSAIRAAILQALAAKRGSSGPGAEAKAIRSMYQIGG